jgi:hypothetical protein
VSGSPPACAQRRGTFAERGYSSPTGTLQDLLGWERFEARRREGRFDDAAMFDAIAAVIDAKARPLTGDDDRGAGQRQAEALADVCGFVLDHGDVPECGGQAARERAGPAGGSAEPGEGGVSGLRRPGLGGVAAAAVLRL